MYIETIEERRARLEKRRLEKERIQKDKEELARLVVTANQRIGNGNSMSCWVYNAKREDLKYETPGGLLYSFENCRLLNDTNAKEGIRATKRQRKNKGKLPNLVEGRAVFSPSPTDPQKRTRKVVYPEMQ